VDRVPGEYLSSPIAPLDRLNQVFQIGQRVGDRFSSHERIFLAGDAVHTHSPKAGQGMNVSMQDCFNLGWKIAGVVNGSLQRSVLKTYQSERRRIAQDLIAFDHRFSRLFSGRPAKDAADEAGISMAEFKDAFEKGNMFASGIAVDYGTSMIVAKGGSGLKQGDGTDVGGGKVVGKQELATNIKLGMRFPSFKVLSQADARPWHFQEWLRADGRWRLIVFAGDLTEKKQFARLQQLGEALAAPTSFLRKFTPKGAKIDSVIEVLTLHAGPRARVEFFDLHEIFHPFDEDAGWDYNKVFVDDVSYHEGFGDAYTNYGVSREKGCLVVTRPDQYVGYVGALEDVEEVARYFEGILVEPVGGLVRNGVVKNGLNGLE
jgi:phenol 2-monooxygenase